MVRDMRGRFKRRGHRYTYGWFMFSFDRKQNSIKQLSFNLKNKKIEVPSSPALEWCHIKKKITYFFHIILRSVSKEQKGKIPYIAYHHISSVALVVKNPPANARDTWDKHSISELGRSPGGGYGNTLQYSCLENPMDRGAWWATVHWVTKRRTR